MIAPLNLLVIEDCIADFLLIEKHLRRDGLAVNCHQVATSKALAASLIDRRWDAVLSDYNVPGMDFTESLKLLQASLPDVPVILVSGTVGEEKAVGLLKLGVTDFLLKDNLTRLVPAILRAQREIAELLHTQETTQALFDTNQLLREMSALAHIGGWEYEQALGRFSWTEEVARIYEEEKTAEVSLTAFFSYFCGACRQIIESAFSQALKFGRHFDLELEILTPKGNRKWVRMVFAASENSGGAIRIRGSTQDISERKQGEMLLFEQKERAEVTLHSIGDAVITTDAHGNIDYLNPVAEELIGYTMQEAISMPLMNVLNIVDKKQKLPLANPVSQALSNGNSRGPSTDCLLIRRDGGCSVIENSTAPIRRRDGGIIGAVLVLRDVTASQESLAKIAYQAMHDGLTDLPNRLLAGDRLEQAIATAHRDGTCVGVLFLDLDRFKKINDSLGHSSGDAVLEQVAKRLLSVTRATDTVSRQGGDEFMIVMPSGNHRSDFAEMAMKILNAVATPYFIDEQELSMTFSIGISIYPNDGSDAGTLIKNADAAMYYAKDAGRDNYQFYATEMNAKSANRLALEVQLRHALARGEFLVYYQPKIDVTHRELVGAEALIRWQHPDLGLLTPARFIGIAEESGLIAPIGQWVTQEVCRQNQAWLDRGLACVPISVNLSAIQFRNKLLVESLHQLLEETGLPPGLLELELTESVIMQSSETVIKTLHRLKGLGIHLSIDDFGTGYSSLSYLKSFPIDTLKIDQSFVRDIAHDESDDAIIKAIISMAHSLNISVIAEGVETLEQVAFLEANHCDEIQGYYFSRPLPAMRFEELLRAQ